ncbi:hypothetical protein ACNF49_04395 [Actinomadura sp. ATCC 39365]
MVLRGPGSGQQQMVEDAGQAYAAGRQVFVAHLSTPLNKASQGRSFPEIGSLIEAVEAPGWRLEHMATSVLPSAVNRRNNITCLFRRSE